MMHVRCRGSSLQAVQPDLRPRERLVLWMLAKGLDDAAMAAQLGVNTLTARFYVGNVLLKLGAANRSDAVDRALRHRLLAEDNLYRSN